MDSNFTPSIKYQWSRYPKHGKENYEVSSKGDRRFSPLFAKLSDGRTIEEAYQLDIKGYRKFGNDWKLGKGKPPMIPTNDLPKLTTHYFELKNRFNIFKDLVDLSNCCSKLICTDNMDKSIRDFIRIVKSEHRNLVNSTSYDVDDIVLVILDNSTKDIMPDAYEEAMNSLYAAGSVGVTSMVTLPRTYNLSYSNAVNQLADVISPRYTEIPGTGYFINLYEQYRNLWAQWSLENLNLLVELAEKSHGKIITDLFASTDISQARALCDILNKYYNL